MSRATAIEPRTPQGKVAWTQKAIEILSDGEWHDRDEVLAACSALVPAEYAVARYKYYLTSVNTANTAQRIGQARRFVAGHAMRNLQQHGHVIYEQHGRGYRAGWL